MIEEILNTVFIGTRNHETKAREAARMIRKKVVYLIFDHCCAVIKQVAGRVPEEKIREYVERKL